jgi:voltage-gated potassium channel
MDTATEHGLGHMPPRGMIRRSLLRATLSATALVLLYYALPVGGRPGAGAVVLTLGLGLFMVVTTWQIRVVLRADYPGLRTVEAVFTLLPLFLIVFATAYLLLEGAAPGAFNEPLSKTSALYFTVTVFTSVGFGDIVPRSGPARVLTTVQMLADLVVIGLLARVLIAAVQENRRQKSGTGGSDLTPPPSAP